MHVARPGVEYYNFLLLLGLEKKMVYIEKKGDVLIQESESDLCECVV